MRLRRVLVRRFKVHEEPVCLDQLGPGLTIVSGDNEEGKSTILAAIKAALFEPATVGGEVRRAMTPRSGETPEIELDFEVGGHLWSLRKLFKRGGVTLEGGGGRWRDDGAEDQLRSLLGFERRVGRSEPRPAHHGLLSLFWLDQGTTFQLPADGDSDPVAASRDRFAKVLAREVGAAIRSERDQRVLAVVRKEAGQSWTATGRETGALARQRETVRGLHLALDAALATRRRYDELVDLLGVRRTDLAAFEQRGEAARAASALQVVQERLRRIEDQELRRSGLQAEHAAAAAALDAARRTQANRRATAEALQRLAEAAAAEAGALPALALGRDAAERRAVEAERAEADLAAALLAAEGAILAAAARLDCARLAPALQRLEADLAEAEAAATAARDQAALLAAFPVDGAALARLRAAEAAVESARLALRLAATTVEFWPEDDAAGARLDGVAIGPGQVVELTARRELVLSPFGRIVVTPGGERLAAVRAELRDGEAALSGLMAQLGIDSLAAAEQAVGRRMAAERALAMARAGSEAILRSHGCRTVEALRDILAAEAHRLASARAALPAGEAAAATGEEIAAAAARLAAAEQRREECRRQRESAMTLAQAAARAAADARQKHAIARERADGLETQRGAADALLARERAEVDDDALASRLAAAERAEAGAREALAGLDAALASADPDGVRAERLRLERGLERLQGEARRLRTEVRDVEAKLDLAGVDALDESSLRLARELALAEAELARQLREARAWRLLRQTADAIQERAAAAVAQPVLERLQPYLGWLLPGSSFALDPGSFTMKALERDGRELALASLSIGTREQLALLVRLALARLLLDREGEAPCLVLDDALVYSDERRFSVMMRVLEHAARDLQILVLTCRPRDYFGLDARFVRLDACRPS